jgi:hypothetical protein
MKQLVRVSVLIACAGCQATPAPPPQWTFRADARALERLARRVAMFTDSPAAEFAQRVLAKVAPCSSVVSVAPAGHLEALLDNVGCAAGPLQDISWTAPGVEGHARVDERGGAEVTLLASQDAVTGAARWLFPAATPNPPGALLNGQGTVLEVHARAAEPLDLSLLLPEGMALERMVGLQARVLSSSVLDGRWELLVYPPEGTRPLRAVASLGVRGEAAGRAALATAVAEVESRWHLQKEPFQRGGQPGACFPNVHVLPGLAPCALALPTAVVVAWNVDTLEDALKPGARAENAGVTALWDLARMHVSDEEMAQGRPVPGVAWNSIHLAATQEAARARFFLSLVAPP